MLIKMLETQPGAPDGINTVDFVKGQTYELNGAGPEDLGRVFLEEGWAEEVKGAVKQSDRSTPTKTKDRTVGVRTKPAADVVITEIVSKLDVLVTGDVAGVHIDDAPTAKEIGDALGYKITAKERAEGFEQFQALKAAAASAPVIPAELDLKNKSRPALNEIATSLGIEDPASFPHIGALKTAIIEKHQLLLKSKENVS